jgi:hypothetical protein
MRRGEKLRPVASSNDNAEDMCFIDEGLNSASLHHLRLRPPERRDEQKPYQVAPDPACKTQHQPPSKKPNSIIKPRNKHIPTPTMYGSKVDASPKPSPFGLAGQEGVGSAQLSSGEHKEVSREGEKSGVINIRLKYIEIGSYMAEH